MVKRCQNADFPQRVSNVLLGHERALQGVDLIVQWMEEAIHFPKRSTTNEFLSRCCHGPRLMKRNERELGRRDLFGLYLPRHIKRGCLCASTGNLLNRFYGTYIDFYPYP